VRALAGERERDSTSDSTARARDDSDLTFEEHEDSDPIIEDLEVALDSLREELHLFASRKGSMVGPITNRDTGDTIDLRRMGSGGWAVPSIVEDYIIQFFRHEA
jgi:DNA topoisomerase-6 subunit A